MRWLSPIMFIKGIAFLKNGCIYHMLEKYSLLSFCV